jgi:hypothetical protein
MRVLILIICTAFTVLSVCSPVDADTVYLKSGGRLEGEVLEQTEAAVRVQVAAGESQTVITLKASHVERVETAPTFASRLGSADGLLRVGESAMAEQAYRALVREEPHDAQARIGLADALSANFKDTEALKTLENYLVMVPEGRDPALLMRLAEQYLKARNFRDARKTVQEAAALKPDDKQFQAAANEFKKRVDRSRSGAEQAQERIAAEQSERQRLKDERATWNKGQGNNKEAEQAGKMLEGWTVQYETNMLHGRYVEITVPADALGAYMAGGPARDLQDRVTRCDAKITVNEAVWLSLFDHQKATYIYGWYYQLRDRYPRCAPVITVVAEVEERGKKEEKRLARGSWDGRRESITIDRWTKENRDPTRPTRPVVR